MPTTSNNQPPVDIQDEITTDQTNTMPTTSNNQPPVDIQDEITSVAQQLATIESKYIEIYKAKFLEFKNSNDEQLACPSTLTKRQREILHQLAEELKLNHITKGNYKSKILYIYKSQFNIPNQRKDEIISQQLQVQANVPIPMHQNVLDVVAAAANSNSSSQAPDIATKKKPGRPRKNNLASTQPTTSTITDSISPRLLSQQPPSSNNSNIYNLRKRKA